MSDYIKDIGRCEQKEFMGGTQYPVITSTVELENNQGILRRGAILGKITSTNKFKLVDTTANDGSQIANCVLAHDINTEFETLAVCYTSGQFKLEHLYIKDEGDILKHLEELRLGNIYVTVGV